MNGSEMVDLCEQALDDRWVVLVFHGVGYGHFPVGRRHLGKLCRYLARRRDRLWTAPVLEVADWVAKRQEPARR
jgi:hypothetical protein